MENYYAALGLACTASPEEIQKAFFIKINEGMTPSQFAVCTQGYAILSNPYKRARYDKTFGYFLVIQTEPATYPSAITLLINAQRPFYGLQKIIQQMPLWITKNLGLSWEEAQEESYTCLLDEEAESPRLVLHFPREMDRTHFAQHLRNEKLVKL